MSYQEFFDAALHATPSGELLSPGTVAVMSLANLEHLEARQIPGDHDAHVHAAQVDRTSRLVQRVLTNFCPPPVENDVVPTGTAPAASGQVVGTLTETTAVQPTAPVRPVAPITKRGASASPAKPATEACCSSLSTRQTSCAVPAPVVPSPSPAVDTGATFLSPSLKPSNLDLTGMRLVKKGRIVAYHGLRYEVTRVNRGYFYAKRLNISGLIFGLSERLRCESVEVVA